MATSLYDWLGKRTYAQSGEDVIAGGELKELKESRTQEIKVPAGPGLADWGPLRPGPRGSKTGFYVDVGAYHPKLFSNTYLFYKKGWRGICIEPNPRMKKLFLIARPRDVFVSVGVGENQELKNSRNQGIKTKRVLEYFEFEDGAVNTFSAEQARKNQEEAGRKLIGKRRIPVLPLKTILDRYLPKGQKIDLLSVDAEGMDLEVLRSNDWKKYRPEMIIAEDLTDRARPYRGFNPSRPGPAGGGSGGVVRFLDSVGYRLVAKTPYSVIFRVQQGVSLKV